MIYPLDFRGNPFFFSLKWNFFWRGIIYTHLWRVRRKPSEIGELQKEQANFYILHVDVEGEDGASVASVSRVSISLSDGGR